MVSSGAIIPARAPASMLMLQMVMRPSMERARMAEPAYSTTQPVAPAVPMRPMMCRTMSLAVTPVGERALDVDAEGVGLGLGEGLRGEDVLDLGGADAEGERAEGAVGGGVRVAADDGHAGLGEAKLGADDVDDALRGRLHVEELDAEFGAVAAEGFDLAQGGLVDDVEAVGDGGGGDVVVYRGDGAVGTADLAVGETEAVECLGRGDLVDELEIDVEERGLACGLGDEMLLPDFFEEGAGM